MILIVEGLDRCGKSTLIKQLRKSVLTKPETISLHCSSPPNGFDINWSMNHYRYILHTAAKLSEDGWDVIMDRSHLGEDVFGPLFRDTSGDFIYDLEATILCDSEVKLIMIIDSPESIIKRDDGDSHTVTMDGIKNVSDRFLKVFQKTHINDKMVYHISNDGGFTNMFQTVKEFVDCKP